MGLEDAGHKKVEKYSLGMKQRLGIAAAILGSPDIILLDEPINAIDGEGVEEIRSLILSLKNEKRIIIVACHDKEEMNLLADEIVHLRDGRIEGQENGGQHEVWKDVEVRSALWYRQTFWILPASAAA